MKTDIVGLLAKHRFFVDLKQQDIERLAACGELLEIEPVGLLATEGTKANTFYVVVEGRVAIETHVPGQPPIVLQTVEAGDVLGWSWIDDQDWVFDARPLTQCRLIALDASEVMKLIESDAEFGLQIMRRLNRVVTQRLCATRLQLLDIYGKGVAGE